MKIYVISLKNSLDRRASIEQQMASYGLTFEFFDAIDGRINPPHPIFFNYDYAKRLWFTSGKMPSKGELGCYASHYLLWQKCIELGEPIVILEDDVKIKPELQEYIRYVADEIGNFGFLRLQLAYERSKCLLKKNTDKYSISFLTNNFGGAIGYALSPQSASKLVNASERWSMPVDNYIGSLYLHNMPSFLFSPSLIEHPENFETTIQNDRQCDTPIYRKPTREFYSLYRKIRMALSNYVYKK
ncbi:glycosyltransferase family 25 protein [Vibrio tarriae]|uniref:glycosyltransferase family 25 protein n=1 Tax=Vibrio tarriae TaxID=2014742 RepID=UPI000DE4D0C0|nr:glycosyltransferase family 25 protein [Vibrio tarriae]RBM42825.1 glycosyl transferase [Vibrio tarriae]